ncbi:hypothetical protein G6F22_020474 [Rhizopus arrhizus]|nr:hypothetical protein G6F22_020474 [Rhizopus arrhizus]
MVQDAAARCHAAGGYDDFWHGRRIKRLGLLHVADANGNPVGGAGFRRREPLVSSVAQIHIHRAAGHRAVQVHGKVLRNSSRLLEASQMKQQQLGTPHCEGRDHDGAAPLDGAKDDFAQGVQHIFRRRQAIAIGGLDH